MRQIAKQFFAAWVILAFAMPALAHGVRIDHTIDEVSGEITITAAFDTGEVLDEAAVIIFAPDDLINPWTTGTMDEDGSYTFMPDYANEGFWDIQVRKAGHGGLINIEIREDMMPEPAPEESTETESSTPSTVTLNDETQIVISGDATFQVEGDIVIMSSGAVDAQEPSEVIASGTSSGFTPAQIAIMSASVVWGFIGTALFFARRRPTSEK